MCDMQKMPSREDASCEDEDMNFATFSAVNAAGTHFVTTGGQMPVTKIQQGVSNNGMQQVVVSGIGMGDGVQYVRTLDGGAVATPQLISVPISLPGSKPGDPQQTVQIQVLNPNLIQQQQQPKYQMQIPIQGFQQGGAVLTLAYNPEGNESGGFQLVGNSLPEGTFRMRTGVQVVAALPQDMQLMQQAQAQAQNQQQNDNKERQIQHQVFITPNQQIVISPAGAGAGAVRALEDVKPLMLNNNNNEDVTNIVIKEECDENMNEDESSQGTENSDSTSWQTNSSSHADLLKYLNTLPPQQTQQLPSSLQQFLRMNPNKATVDTEVEEEEPKESLLEPIAEAVIGDDGVVRIQSKKKKKYKKKPSRPPRPKPGQVVIATAADGTPIFCCPECSMAYPDKEQLEMHLIVHKIERRFICGICGAGLKRKEHLERHKLGHNPERPYVCDVCCKGFKRREHLNLHTVIHSGVKSETCTECGKGFYRKDHLRKHMRSHESKRAREEAAGGEAADVKPVITTGTTTHNNTIMPEITIHVPTSACQVPVQISIPQHVVTSLQAAQQAQAQAQAQSNAQAEVQAHIDALLAQHS